MAVRAIGGIVRLVSPLPPPLVPTIRALRPGAVSAGVDKEDGGKYRVAGTTKVEGSPKLPVSRRVRLHDQLTGRLVRELWSTAGTGAYSFDNIKAGVYYVVALDHTHVNNAVIAADFAAVAM